MIFRNFRINYSSAKMILGYLIPNVMIVFLLLAVITSLTGCTDDNDAISNAVENNSEIHYILPADIGDAFKYWNTAWLEHSSELYDEIRALTTTYLKTQKYVYGENDCNDMAVDLWQKLRDREIISLIAVGNLKKSDETFPDCNHAWLIVYSGEGSAGIIDLASGRVYIWENVRTSPQLRQYWEGFVYEKPSDLLVDFKERW